MKWIQIRVKCRPGDVDNVSAVMSMLDGRLMIEDLSDIMQSTPDYGELIDESLLDAAGEAAVSVYVSDEVKCREYTDFLNRKFADSGKKYDIQLIGIDDQDWANSWKQYYKPQKIGERIVIVPEWEEYTPAAGEIVVLMDPGMAFGTGGHESTRLCARLLERHMRAGARVLDIGTGSGILAVIASKLGASRVDALDIDPAAVKTAVENTKLNDCGNINCVLSDLLSEALGVYDFITANITADTIIRMAGELGGYLRRGGYFAASGIIEERGGEVTAALESGGVVCADTEVENGWVGILYKK